MSKKKQVLIFTSGQIDWDFQWATCNVANDQFIYLCFHHRGSTELKQCRKSSSPTGPFSEISQTTHEHMYTRIASSSGKLRL